MPLAPRVNCAALPLAPTLCLQFDKEVGRCVKVMEELEAVITRKKDVSQQVGDAAGLAGGGDEGVDAAAEDQLRAAYSNITLQAGVREIV